MEFIRRVFGADKFPRANIPSQSSSYGETASNQLVNLEEFEPPKFSVGDPRLVEYLNENGYAVVASVATAEEVAVAQTLLWKFLEPTSHMKQFDSSTWTDENFCKIGSTRNGILAYSGINHSDFLWCVFIIKY